MMEKQFQNVKHNIIFALILKLIKLIAKEIILQVVKTKDVHGLKKWTQNKMNMNVRKLPDIAKIISKIMVNKQSLHQQRLVLI